MRAYTKGVITGVIFMFMIAATNVAWNAWRLQVRDTATIGGAESGPPEILAKLTVESDTTSEKTIVLKQRASQTADSLEIQNSSGTEIFSVDKDGDCSAASIDLDGNTSDPCTSLEAGSVFYNSTNSIMCYCNTNLDALKIDGTSASCF